MLLNMKNPIIVFLICVATLFGKTNISSAKNAVYFEYAGTALNSSINYELLARNDIPIRIGLGYINAEQSVNFGDKFSENQEASLVPITIGKLIGQKQHNLELGAGFIIKYFHRESQFENEKNGVLLSGLIGYRYQSIKNRGFLVRLTLSPIYQPIDEGFKVYTGVSIGYLF